MADLARIKSEQLSLRIKSGIRSRKAQGLHTSMKVNSVGSREKSLGKHKEVIRYLKLGGSCQEITKLTGAAPYTIS
jgi:putative DNA-invertase from lambdoid prophage Rac